MCVFVCLYKKTKVYEFMNKKRKVRFGRKIFPRPPPTSFPFPLPSPSRVSTFVHTLALVHHLHRHHQHLRVKIRLAMAAMHFKGAFLHHHGTPRRVNGVARRVPPRRQHGRVGIGGDRHDHGLGAVGREMHPCKPRQPHLRHGDGRTGLFDVALQRERK